MKYVLSFDKQIRNSWGEDLSETSRNYLKNMKT